MKQKEQTKKVPQRKPHAAMSGEEILNKLARKEQSEKDAALHGKVK